MTRNLEELFNNVQFDNTQTDESQTDELVFAQEDDDLPLTAATDASPSGSWKILIVDDEIDVHNITQLALRDFRFEDQSLTFINTYSAQEAQRLMQLHPDIAVILLDVVMETEDAGLQLVKYIREELGNPLVRIILRTGQPGRAPEDFVAVNYGIDDYKTKTELTASKLFITMITALRAFSTLMKVLKMVRQPDELPPQTHLSTVRREGAETIGQLIGAIADTVETPANLSDVSYTVSAITRTAKMVLRVVEEHLAKLGTSQTKLDTLTYLNDEPEKCASPSALAKYCGVSRAAMTGLLDGLEKDGYVERENHPFDRRALMVKITPKGEQFLEWVTPQEQYQLSELMDALDETERKKLITLASKTMELGDYHLLPASSPSSQTS